MTSPLVNACPFCGEYDGLWYPQTTAEDPRYGCSFCGIFFLGRSTYHKWNERPIEDKLRKEANKWQKIAEEELLPSEWEGIIELREENDRLKREIQELKERIANEGSQNKRRVLCA